MSQYKREHENFVTGHNGTTLQEIAALTSIPCVGCFAREVILLFAANGLMMKRERFLLDFTTLVMPSVLAVSLFSEFIGHIFFFILVFSVLFYYLLYKRSAVEFEYALQRANLNEQKTFITWFRSLVNLMTALAILAVDFPVYPRRLAKAETYGFGGMDVGVGFFVVANAIVSPEARGKHVERSILNSLKLCVSGSIPLLILGLGRLLAVKGTDYHEHITEYGVHWNFFFTLAALKLVSTLLHCVVNTDRSLMAGLLVTALHQLLLSVGGLSEYVRNGLDGKGSRAGILDANREGILSIPGYLAIYCFGVSLGQFLFMKRENLRDWLKASRSILCVVVVCMAVTVTLHYHVEQVSRRLANAAFVFWIVGNGCLMLLECLLAEIAVMCARWAREHNQKTDRTVQDEMQYIRQSGQDETHPRLRVTNITQQNVGVAARRDLYESGPAPSPCLLEAVSSNALLFFLAANVMTGVVNMSMRTMYASSATAVSVITIYLLTLCFVFVVLKRKNIRSKVW